MRTGARENTATEFVEANIRILGEKCAPTVSNSRDGVCVHVLVRTECHVWLPISSFSFRLPPAGLWLTSGPHGSQHGFIFEKCERPLRFCATNYSVLSLEEKSCQRSQRLAGDQSFDASQRVASSFFASLCDRPHAEHWAFCVRNILLNVDIHTSADYSNQF